MIFVNNLYVFVVIFIFAKEARPWYNLSDRSLVCVDLKATSKMCGRDYHTKVLVFIENSHISTTLLKKSGSGHVHCAAARQGGGNVRVCRFGGWALQQEPGAALKSRSGDFARPQETNVLCCCSARLFSTVRLSGPDVLAVHDTARVVKSMGGCPRKHFSVNTAE